MSDGKLRRGNTAASGGPKRAAPKAAARPKPKAKVRKTSVIDRLIRALPVSESGLQKGMTFGLLGGVVVVGLAVASAAGVPDMARAELANVASDNGFRVRHLVVDGMDNIEETEVYAIIADQKDRSMPLLDLDKIRGELIALSWVEDARVSRRLPDTLHIEITERQVAAVWQDGGRYARIDPSGHVLESIKPGSRPDLPILSGANANKKALDLAALLDAAPALKEQVKAAKWVSNRRWDLQFKTGETLQLPEGTKEAETALLKFARFDGVNRLLGHDLVNFDMRDPKNLYVRKVVTEKPETASTDRKDKEG